MTPDASNNDDDGLQRSHGAPKPLDTDEEKRAAELIQVSTLLAPVRQKLTTRGAPSEATEHDVDKQFQEEIEGPVSSQPQRGGNTPPSRANWTHVINVAKRAAKDDHSSSESNDDANDGHYGQETDPSNLSPEQRVALKRQRQEARELSKKKAKMMELQYWLEFVDKKHRHGSNLRKYHVHWQSSDTNENFFYWLDQGGGKHLDLPECSRERLDHQQVRYLSREERLDYLVEVGTDGLLRWAKNGQKVWTKDELFKDSIHGIVPATDPTPAFKHNVKPESSSSSSSSSSESSSDDEDSSDESSLSHATNAPDEGENYINEDFHRASGPAKLKYVSAGVVFNHMIRKSLQKGHKWIFVCDTSLRLYIGYKQTGAFQHSSFLHGSRILAAGQIKVKDGQLRRLSPLSGHYRPPAANFRTFVKSLKSSGVDMSHVSVSRSYAVLVGLEGYVQSRRKVKKAEKEVAHRKDRIFKPEKAKEEEEKQLDNSKSAAKEREFLEQQQLAEAKAQRQAKLTKRSSRKQSLSTWLQRLGLRSRGSQSDVDDGAGRATRREDQTDHRTGPEDGIPRPDEPVVRKSGNP
ncbi:uncharacterized protein HMPREF1541_01966 [Cyphellophora europaea CBS 101466]|uniref:IQ domain-containing protein IQM6 n=1 Tax=Cyphellophora europaea (strain CBS 101466) TaxID=1220924 RepID=W2S428_CYPE1|nr:uncharacterized protein HMPREF1541_01966 [Cyphellophora europaea CBS 101466]ETN42808.1 hypothetical protein HMPREF1541_01966 [Cyphellophora europaea CBS 101466]